MRWPQKFKLESGIIALLIFIILSWYYSYIPKIKPSPSNSILRYIEYLDGILWWEGYIVVVGIFVVGYCYLTRDDLSAWLLTFAWGAAVGVNLGGMGITGSLPGLGFRILWGIVVGFASAITLGTLSFTITAYLQKHQKDIPGLKN